MLPGQLSLFKGKRQRGVAPPPAPEFSLHCMVADVLVRWCVREWRYTHMPMGEKRDPATAGRLKRMGVTKGWPDFQFFHINGVVAFLELKRKGERPSDEQIAMAFFAMRAGHGYLITDNFRDAIDALRAWRIVPVTISV
jgi:hypothetical protein